MIKKLKKTPLLSIIKQIVIKQKYIFKLIKNINKKELNLLEFLWIEKYIFGFSLKTLLNEKNNFIIVYLKINKLNNNLLCQKLNIYKNKKEIQQIKKWSKNSFFIIITTKGILNAQKSITRKIGGFILNRIH